jgi:FkbM family methyltransferase
MLQRKPELREHMTQLQSGILVADIGAGTGYFSVRIARRIPEGKIFAADIEPDMVRYLGERARREHLINLVPVQASADAVNLPEPVAFCQPWVGPSKSRPPRSHRKTDCQSSAR